MSDRTTFILCIMLAYEIYATIMYLVTGNIVPYLPVPPGFGILVAVYWVSVIADIRNYYRAVKKAKKGIRAKRKKAKGYDDGLRKAG